MRRKLIIGVVGHTGTIGSNVYSYFLKKKYQTIGISRRVNSGRKDTTGRLVQEADIIFICVPTPFLYKQNVFDISAVRDCVLSIAQAKTVIIKSTIPPGTTEELQRLRPDLRIFFNPEFLSRKTARKDFEHPVRQIIGYTNVSKGGARRLLKILPQGAYSAVMTSTEAELVKYAHNVFGAIAVTYANHLYDVSQTLHADYEKIFQAFSAPPGVKSLRRYGTIFHNNKRGYGGPCFPKDVNSFLVFCKNLGIKVEIIQAARDANRRLLRAQHLTEQTAESY